MIYGRLTQGPLGAAPPPNLSMFCFVPILLIYRLRAGLRKN